MLVVIDTYNITGGYEKYDHVTFAVKAKWFDRAWWELGYADEYKSAGEFDEVYTWDDTLPLYEKAIADGAVVWEQYEDFFNGSRSRVKWYPYKKEEAK